MGIFFPAPLEGRKWRGSLGIVTFTTPEELTEEVRVRVPAGDAHVMRQLHKGLSLDARLLIQGVQNHLSLGLRWAMPPTRDLYFSVGDDMAYWRGDLIISGFDTRATGWLNYPNVAFGYRTAHDLLITAKAEMIITPQTTFIIEGKEREYRTDPVSGASYSLYLEQPFFKRTHVILGFTATFTDRLWAAWSLFDGADRTLFYPQITLGLLL